MSRLSSLAVLGVATLGLSLATPAISRAQSFGVQVGIGRTQVVVGNGYSYLPSVAPRYDIVYRPSYYGPSLVNPGLCYPPTQIVVPQYEHWTPYRGYHTHGQVVAPHNGHYHTRPY